MDFTALRAKWAAVTSVDDVFDGEQSHDAVHTRHHRRRRRRHRRKHQSHSAPRRRIRRHNHAPVEHMSDADGGASGKADGEPDAWWHSESTSDLDDDDDEHSADTGHGTCDRDAPPTRLKE